MRGDRHRRGPRGARGHRRAISASARCRGRDHAADAGNRHHLTQQSDRRGVSRARLAGGQRTLRPMRALSHQRRGLRVLHVQRHISLFARFHSRQRSRIRSACIPYRKPWFRQLADRLHGRAGAPVRADPQNPGHESHLPAGDLAMGSRGLGSRKNILHGQASRDGRRASRCLGSPGSGRGRVPRAGR